MAVFGAVWIKAPVAKYVTALKDIEQFEKARTSWRRSGSAIRRAWKTLRRCACSPKISPTWFLQGRDCEIKLGEAALGRLRQDVDCSQPTAGASPKRWPGGCVEYVNGYLEGGDARLAAYRDSTPTFVGKEFASMVERLRADRAPAELKAYLLGFPADAPRRDVLLYRQEAKFGLKPTIRVNHLIIDEQPNGVVANKMLLRQPLLLDGARTSRAGARDGGGRLLVRERDRSRSDGLTGFTGSLIRGKVRDEAKRHGGGPGDHPVADGKAVTIGGILPPCLRLDTTS